MTGLLATWGRRLGLDRIPRAGRDAAPPSTAHDAEALVYRGPATLPGCAESVADVLAARGLSVAFVGPQERLPLEAASLRGRRLYAQPGGPDLDEAWGHIEPAAEAIRDYVHGGGRYLGFCLGGYLAGKGPGLGLLSGDTDQYIGTTRASVDHEGDAIVTVLWQGRPRQLYFQDGPYFALGRRARAAQAEVIASYDNGLPAALLCRYGAGVVAAVGPHPEAGVDWFSDAGLDVPDPLGLDLAADLVDRVLTA